MIIEGEKTFFGEPIDTAEDFIKDLYDRLDRMYTFTIQETNKSLQLRYIMGFLRGFKNRLNRVCEKSYKIYDFEIIGQNDNKKDMNDIIFEGEETFFGETITTPEEFIDDFCNRIDILFKAAMEEEQDMHRLTYSLTSLMVLNDRLNRVCKNI
ncbi:MAG: hypothetical protein ACFFE4_21725 [Candidatus Thorarchaeota archaeon]